MAFWIVDRLHPQLGPPGLVECIIELGSSLLRSHPQLAPSDLACRMLCRYNRIRMLASRFWPIMTRCEVFHISTLVEADKQLSKLGQTKLLSELECFIFVLLQLLKLQILASHVMFHFCSALTVLCLLTSNYVISGSKKLFSTLGVFYGKNAHFGIICLGLGHYCLRLKKIETPTRGFLFERYFTIHAQQAHWIRPRQRCQITV